MLTNVADAYFEARFRILLHFGNTWLQYESGNQYVEKRKGKK